MFIDHQPQRRFHCALRRHVRFTNVFPNAILLIIMTSYFVTELLGTDLHRLLTSRPLEKQFIQYFLYQILVSAFRSIFSLVFDASKSVASNMYTLRAWCIVI